jgi:histidine decarboxylase
MQVAPSGYTPKYVGSPDTTLAGSRNGLSPLLLAHHIQNTTEQEEIAIIRETFQLIDWFVQEMHLLEQVLQLSLWIERSSLSLAVRFRKVCSEIVEKHSIASEIEDGWDIQKNEYATIEVSHIYIMRNTKKETLHSFLDDCRKLGRNAFLTQKYLTQFAIN